MIEIVRDHTIRGWRDYCLRHKLGQYSHLPEWTNSLAEVYALSAFFLIARQAGMPERVHGVVPLIHFASPDASARLISLPFTDGAGILADNPAAGNELLAAALALADSLGALHLELRQYAEAKFDPGRSGPEWVHQAHTFKVGLQRPLPSATAALWDDLPAKVRNQVRKAWRSGCVGRVGGAGLLDDFYAVFSENMRDLGSPTHPAALFERLLAGIGDEARCLVVYAHNTPVAASLVFALGGTLCNPWAASLRRYRPLCANMLLYWLMLCHGVRRGCTCFDFGRSTPGTATCRFKEQWRARKVPLTWHVFSRPPHQWHPAEETLVFAAWKHLDLAASRLQGPAIRRWISL